MIIGVLIFSIHAFAADIPKPNIIFIMADDMGYGDPQCYNPESKIPTPHMDALAQQGVSFIDAHTAASVCTPSRYGVLTGRYCWRTRLKSEVLWTTFDEPLIEKDRITVASLARKHGYATASIGKWHLGMNFYRKDSDAFARGKLHHMSGLGGCKDVDFSREAEYSPNDTGFNFSFVIGAGHNLEPYCFIRNRTPVSLPTLWREADSPTLEGSSSRESHEGWMSPGWIDEQVDIEFAQQAVRFIERTHADDPKKPFFLYLTPGSPHRPCVPTEDFKGKTGIGLREDYVAQFDWIVGEIIKVLDELELAENTILMVTSDNGAVPGGKGHQSSGKLRGQKASLFEGGHRVPFIVRWPARMEKGGVNRTPVCLTGLLATLADLLDVALPSDAGEDSISFLPALLGETQSTPNDGCIVHHDYGGSFAIRLNDWKLIPDRKMLFNLGQDPGEKSNLFSQHPEIVKKLADALEKCRDPETR
jgi:arylsulfatase A